MRKLPITIASAIILTSIFTPAQAQDFRICTGQFALCAASSGTPTGKTITVNGTAFPEIVAVCPVLRGPAIADVAGGNMKGSCDAPGPGKVWSLYQIRENIPQAPDWDRKTAAPLRIFVTSSTAQTSNMFSFACTLTKRVHGVQLANCFGPANENPSGATLPAGTTVVTQSPAGSTYPVSGPLP
ncbi:MAG: hypothetical protein QOK37_895 [Thermoanaerobaculia bacterium]|jgi:hypothetical protein|nr:hypothetical protein [Thermoanaerobaculia bacterium]